MSTLSDVDLRDWDFGKVRSSLAAIDDCSVDSQKEWDFINSFVDKVEKLVTSQQKQIAALFLPPIFKEQHGFQKASDGCCHKTVVTRCDDCVYKELDG